MSTSYLKSPTSSSTSSFSSQEHIPLNPPTLSSTSTSSTLSIFCVARFIEQFTLEDPSTREKEAGWWCCWRLLLIFCCVYCPQKIVFVFCKRVVGVVNDLLVLLKNANDRSYVEQHCGCLQGQDGCWAGHRCSGQVYPDLFGWLIDSAVKLTKTPLIGQYVDHIHMTTFAGCKKGSSNPKHLLHFTRSKVSLPPFPKITNRIL